MKELQRLSPEIPAALQSVLAQAVGLLKLQGTKSDDSALAAWLSPSYYERLASPLARK